MQKPRILLTLPTLGTEKPWLILMDTGLIKGTVVDDVAEYKWMQSNRIHLS